MGKFDNLDKTYFGRKEHLAELIEHGIYRGRLSVTEGELTLLKAEYPSAKNGERRRDILSYAGKHRIKYGFEIENYVDYGMPKRIMEYDTGEYAKEAAEIRTRHERAGDYKNFTERKSGLSEDEKYKPVVTAVLYLGVGHYKGRKTLKECLDIPQNMLPYVDGTIQNYTFPLIEADFVNPDDYNTELRQFFKAMQCRYDEKELLSLFQTEEFQNITTDTRNIIALHLDNDKIKEKVITEDMDMCKALTDLENRCRKEGIEVGREEGREEEKILNIKNLMESLGIMAEKAMELLKIPYEEQGRCLEILNRN